MSYFSHFVVFTAGGFVFGFGLCVWFLVFCVCGFCVCLFTFKLYLVGKKKGLKSGLPVAKLTRIQIPLSGEC